MTDRACAAAGRLAAFEADICEQQGVTLQVFPPATQIAARMKIKRLWQMSEENAGLEVAISGHDQQNAQPAYSASLVKVVLRGQNRASVVRCPREAQAGDIAALVAKVLGRDARLMLRIAQNEVKLSEQGVAQALQLVRSKELHAIVVVAD
jgi:hypothetical protein